MTADARILTGPSPWSRVIGLGSIYGKTVRDSLRAALVVGGVASLFMFGTGAPYGLSADFATVALRQQFVDALTALPTALRGLLGEPINLLTMGGFLSWRVGNTLPVLLGLWPIIALSGTLAGEAAKGSLDLLAATPQGRRTIAVEKLVGHITAVAIAMLMLAISLWLIGAFLGTLPGDAIPFGAALGQVLLYGLMMLAVGGVTFATAPFLGRTRAMAFGFIVLFASYLIYAYATLSPLIAALEPLSIYVWTAGHRPIAGVSDWGSVALLAGVDAVLFVIGVVAFARRDLGSTANVGWIRLPSLPAGIAGPFTRQLADRTGVAIGWGLGVGLYGLLIVASAAAFSETVGSLPQLVAIIEAIYPGIDISQPSGVLQLTFFGFGSFIFGIAGASFLAGWASDEGRRRLEVVLSTPRSRASWTWRSAAGVLAAIAVMSVIVGLFIGIGVLAGGGNDAISPVAGIGVLGLASAAFAGVGLAVGGLVRTSLAAGVAGVLVIATFLLDTLGAALKLPDAILELSLYKHLGQPMAGIYDPVGIVIAAIMVVGGVALCTFGLTRRDIGR
jgi:ABC-2 type transport system permease protein